MINPTQDDGGHDMSDFVYPTENAVKRSFTVENVYYEYLRRLGGGNASKGLRLAVIGHAKQNADSGKDDKV